MTLPENMIHTVYNNFRKHVFYCIRWKRTL